MVDRITLTKTCYMELEGQWQIVLAGSVIDVPSAEPFAKVATVQTGTGTLINTRKARPHAVRKGF